MEMIFDASEVLKVFRKLPERSLAVTNRLIRAGAIDIQREERIQVNVGASGELRRSIGFELHPERLSAEVGSTLERAIFLEEGTKPHWTSIDPGTDLYKWAKHKGFDEDGMRMLQLSIAKKGTKAHPFVAPTFKKMKPVVIRDIERGFLRYIDEVNNGRV